MSAPVILGRWGFTGGSVALLDDEARLRVARQMGLDPREIGLWTAEELEVEEHARAPCPRASRALVDAEEPAHDG